MPNNIKYRKAYITVSKKEIIDGKHWTLTFTNNQGKKDKVYFASQELAVRNLLTRFENVITRIHDQEGKWKYYLIKTGDKTEYKMLSISSVAIDEMKDLGFSRIVSTSSVGPKVKYGKVYITMSPTEMDESKVWRLSSTGTDGKKEKLFFSSQSEAIDYFKDNFEFAHARVHGDHGKWKYYITKNQNDTQYKVIDSKEKSDRLEKLGFTQIIAPTKLKMLEMGLVSSEASAQIHYVPLKIKEVKSEGQKWWIVTKIKGKNKEEEVLFKTQKEAIYSMLKTYDYATAKIQGTGGKWRYFAVKHKDKIYYKLLDNKAGVEDEFKQYKFLLVGSDKELIGEKKQSYILPIFLILMGIATFGSLLFLMLKWF